MPTAMQVSQLEYWLRTKLSYNLLLLFIFCKDNMLLKVDNKSTRCLGELTNFTISYLARVSTDKAKKLLAVTTKVRKVTIMYCSSKKL